jgi:hypothetical protein
LVGWKQVIALYLNFYFNLVVAVLKVELGEQPTQGFSCVFILFKRRKSICFLFLYGRKTVVRETIFLLESVALSVK